MSAPKRYFLFVFPLSEMSHFHWFNIAHDCLIYLYVCSVKIDIWQYGRLTRRSPPPFRYFILFITDTACRKFLKYLEWKPFEILKN